MSFRSTIDVILPGFSVDECLYLTMTLKLFLLLSPFHDVALAFVYLIIAMIVVLIYIQDVLFSLL